MRNRLAFGPGLTLAVVVATAAAMARPAPRGGRFADCADDRTRPGGPRAHAVLVSVGDRLSDLVDASAIVVEGEVVDVRPGRIVGDFAGGDLITQREAVIAVRDLVAGDLEDEFVIVEETGWDREGREVPVDGAPMLTVGDAGVFFVGYYENDGDRAPGYTLPQGRYLAVGESEEKRRLTERDPKIADLAAASPSELKAAVRALVR